MATWFMSSFATEGPYSSLETWGFQGTTFTAPHHLASTFCLSYDNSEVVVHMESSNSGAWEESLIHPRAKDKRWKNYWCFSYTNDLSGMCIGKLAQVP